MKTEEAYRKYRNNNFYLMLESQILAILLQRCQNWDLPANWCLKAEPALLLLLLNNSTIKSLCSKIIFPFHIFLKLEFYGAKQAGSRKRITPKANQKLNSKCDYLGCLTSLWWRLWSKRNWGKNCVKCVAAAFLGSRQ